MTDQHLPQLILDELLTNERERTNPAVAAHLEACEWCRRRLDEQELDGRVALQRRPPAAFVAELVKRQRKRIVKRYLTIGLAAAAACALLFSILPPFEHEPTDHLLLRGRSALEIVKLESGKVRFRILSAEPAHACVFHTEDGVRFELLSSLSIEAGLTLVPGTYAITPSEGAEHVVAALFDDAVDCSALRPSLKDQRLLVTELPRVSP